MNPAALTTELRTNLLDYVRATLALDDPTLEQALLDYLAGDEGLFRGPYLRLGLPFSVPSDDQTPLHIAPPFKPYTHQLQSFRQLSSVGEPRNTLVTTGTGSGKTECFLYPILDHCWRMRQQRQPGIKAILIYPMNALATDQARRLAEIIHGDARLHGLKAGLYVGGNGEQVAMGAGHLIDNKPKLRSKPPDILLTNYKMLDFMLLRPDERGLWRHNQPETLRYLAVDELHTFDGAQGSDVACLIRRLKARLSTPNDHLICAGTSATIGSSTDPETFERLAGFAELVFGEPFKAEDVVREHRESLEQFLRKPKGRAVPVASATAINGHGTDWDMHGDASPLELGEGLRAHPLTHHILAILDGGVLDLDEVDQMLAQRLPEWAKVQRTDRDELLRSYLAMVSTARRDVGGHERPFLTVQLQLWCREMRRLLRALPDQDGGELLGPRFRWWTDLPGAQPTDDVLFAPQAACRECGASGYAAMQSPVDQEHHKLTLDPAEVGRAWFTRSRTARFVWPRPLDAAPDPSRGRQQNLGLTYWLDPQSGALSGTAPIDADGRTRGGPVALEHTLKGQRNRFAARCPACQSDDALRIMGARAASLSSVAVTHLFQSKHLEQRKLLAFTDSVQDASHRAGFFGGRTYRIHLRTALQAVIRAKEPLRLSEAAEAFEAHWDAMGNTTAYLARFVPRDLNEHPDMLRYREKAGKGSYRRLFADLRTRLGWEFTRELGVAAPIGRSLERVGAATLTIDAERLEQAVEQLTSWLSEQTFAEDPAPQHHAAAGPVWAFLFGLVHRMRHMGAIHHTLLDAYVRGRGDGFLLSKRRNPLFTPESPRGKRVRFIASRANDVFPSPSGKHATRGWFYDWALRALGLPALDAETLGALYRYALQSLESTGVVRAVAATKGVTVWGLDPDALWLTTLTGRVQAGHRGKQLVLGAEEARQLDGAPAFRFRSEEHWAHRAAERSYYAEVYDRSEMTRVVTAEHTGLLSREVRESVERRFKGEASASDPHPPNLLVATPTLEMGVDIGDLEATMLCSVPPTPANYLQRVGRAGRKTGNAIVFTLVNQRAHDLWFFADPTQMLDGTVLPPGAYLRATEMLRRQLTAWVMDDWARNDTQAKAVPRHAKYILGAGRQAFPGRLIEHFLAHRERLWAGFETRFAEHMTERGQAILSAWALSETLLPDAINGAFDQHAATIQAYAAERKKAKLRIDAIEKDPTSVADAPLELDELKRYRSVLAALMRELRDAYPLSILANASLLPNYAFPEAGVQLHAMLGSESQDEGEKKRTWEKRAYERPAATAIRELAPFNTFYAEGHRMQVRQLDIGPKGGRVEHWRFCPSCHHNERVAGMGATSSGTCPGCGDAEWADKGQVRAVLPMSTVRSVTDRVRSTTSDDSDERERRAYTTHTLIEPERRPEDGPASLIAEIGFGFEYLSTVQLTELNLGPDSPVEGVPWVSVAGEQADAQGFPTCRDCGTVKDPSPHSREPASMEHTPFCPQRGKESKGREHLFLYRRVVSEALRFLLPFSEVAVDEGLRSFQAALTFGLRRRFRGQPMHLQVRTMSEPRHDAPKQRRHLLVLFDAVPGGTGYLEEFREADEVMRLLQDTLEGLAACPCQSRGLDGCYLCLFAHQAQRWLSILSSKKAQHLLTQVLAHRGDMELLPGGLSGASSDGVTESETEDKFLLMLQAEPGIEVTALPGDVWDVRAGDTLWRLTPQVWLNELNLASRADFVLQAQTGPCADERVVVECDGFAYHVQPSKERGRLSGDVRKRDAIAGTPGWRIFSLAWDDVTAGSAPVAAPAVLCDADAKMWDALFQRIRSKLPEAARDTLRGLPHLGPFRLLCAYLTHPGAHWETAVGNLVLAGLVASARSGKLVRPIDHKRVADRLTEVLEPLPLPPYSFTEDAKRTQQWTRVSSSEFVAACLVIPGHGVASQSVDGLDVVLRIHDGQAQRQAEHFKEGWRSFLHGLNLAQFLPDVTYITTEGLHEVSGASQDVLAMLGIAAAPAGDSYALRKGADRAASPNDGSAPTTTQLDAVLAEVEDPALQQIVRELFRLELPLPDDDPEELPRKDGQGAASPELSWTHLRLAVVDGEWTDPEDIDEARRMDWRVLVLPASVEQVVDAVRQRVKEPR